MKTDGQRPAVDLITRTDKELNLRVALEKHRVSITVV
jgi:hypothetical protein